MTVESATYISDLNTANPGSTDLKAEGDDHLRLIKSTVKATFPNVTGAVTPTHTVINNLASGTFNTVAVTGVTNLTTTGNTILGDAAADTLNVGAGGIVKNASNQVGFGATPTRGQVQIYGAGQTTAALTDAGATGATLFLQDSAIGAGNGGAVAFGAGNAANTAFAAIKGKLTDGTSNSVGDLSVSTRASSGATALTERWVFQGSTGDLLPIASYNIGGTGNRVNGLYATLINTTGDNDGVGMVRARSKASTTSRNTTTTLADDPDLIVPLSVGNWKFEAWLPISAGAGGGGNGFKTAMAFSGTKTGTDSMFWTSDATMGVNTIAQVGSTETIASISTSAAPINYVVCKGSVLVTVAGNLSVQWAQNSSGGQNLNVFVGACLVCTRVA